MKKIVYLLVALALLTGTAGISYGIPEYLSGPVTPPATEFFEQRYPQAVGTRIDACLLCHVNPNPGPAARNAYGTAFANAGHDFGAIEGADSDVDSFTNKAEIDALSFPGNSADVPAPPSDTQAPTVDQFAIPATSNSLTVPITTFTATDNILVTGFMVTESATAPLASDPGWGASAPISFIFATAGPKTLFAWAKDAAGNVSTSRQATTTLVDNTSPTVTSFVIPATHNNLTVPISAFAATDDFGVTGFLVRESDVPAPLAGDADWTPTAPTSFEFLTPGAKTLFAWAKDAAGNISTAASASVTITLTTFADVPANHSFFNQIELVAAAGITGGCQADNPQTPENEANFCPDNPISRGQIAVFIETSLGSSAPPVCTGTMFADVTVAQVGQGFCNFIEAFANRGVTGGCAADDPLTTTVNEARFCPNDTVTRAQMAVFIEAGLGNPANPCGTRFADVTAATVGATVCGFIDRFAVDGITGGCTTTNYCPNDPVTRGQMAVFLVAAPDPLLP